MADAAISFAVEKLGDALIHKVSFLKGIEDQVRWLKDELQSMRCFLKDAAEKQGNNEYGNLVRKWISDVREVAQDAEDVIEVYTLKLDAPTRKRDLMRKWAGFPTHLSHLNRVGREIESIRTRLDEIVRRRERYGIGSLGDVGTESSFTRSEMVELRRRMTKRFQKDKDVVGLNEDVDLLLNNVILDSKKGLSLASIVGMGGIGKSTLARKVYNHPAIAERFEKRAWVVVSSEFAAEDIMKQIMHDLSVPLDADELKTLESIQGKLRRQEILQQTLRKRLVGKHYFIVLDDVWEKTHWESLEAAFPDEQDKMCRVLFTSRNKIITVHRGYVHKMKLLNSDESWELLLKTALIYRKCPQDLEEICREILKKCNGLPLAITIAGGLLVNQRESKNGWDRVSKQIINYHSETSEIGTSVSAILELSYHNLPSQLKPCFLCLAFFKEDEVFQARRLVHIWVALGLVQAGGERVEDMAMSYLDELINRNLVQVEDMSIDDRVKNCYVHDLLREVSISKAKEELCLENLINENECGNSSSYKPRHRVIRDIGERPIMLDSSNQKKHLRSLFIDVKFRNESYLTSSSYWKSFELLRILDIEGSRLPTLPSTICALVGLRYLRLRDAGVLSLPSWLDVLKNLEVLDLVDCMMVIFPDVTWKMESLRHLYIDCACYEFSNSMKKSNWKNLETLKYMGSDNLFYDNQGQGFGQRLRKLGLYMKNGWKKDILLRRLLIESAVQVLHLRWTSESNDGSFPTINSMDHLTKLKIHGPMYQFPTADKFPQNITHLTLTRSKIRTNSMLMQELGKLPNLLFLKLHDVFGTVVSLKVSLAGFPRLKVLQLTRIRCLRSIYVEEGGMAELQRLEISDCPHFENIQNLSKRIKPIEIICIPYTF